MLDNKLVIMSLPTKNNHNMTVNNRIALIMRLEDNFQVSHVHWLWSAGHVGMEGEKEGSLHHLVVVVDISEAFSRSSAAENPTQRVSCVH